MTKVSPVVEEVLDDKAIVWAENAGEPYETLQGVDTRFVDNGG
jgi:hypothetical protein